MLEEMFVELHELKSVTCAMRVLRFYQLLCHSGLRLRRGWYGGCTFKEGREGGCAVLGIGGGLYLSFAVFMGENEHVEFGIMTKDTQDDLTMFHDNVNWALCYTRDDDRPHPDIERLAGLFRVEGDAEPTRIDQLRLRGFLREISLLTSPVTDRSLPATL